MQDNSSKCPCGSGMLFADCCEIFILKKQYPKTAEQLMRSRFCAYAKKQYQYILDTYAQSQRQSLSVQNLQQNDDASQWLSLEIVNCPDPNRVEFKAYSRLDNQFHVLHEISNFAKENKHWVYVDGEIKNDTGVVKLNRNDQCLCGSGKKYKKCCLS